jgi:hypothetical protein
MFSALDSVVDGCARGLGVAVALQSAEHLRLRAAFGPSGIWRFDILEAQFPRFLPLRWALRQVLQGRGFVALLALRICAGLLLAGFGLSPLVLYVWCSTALLGWRGRGHFNGGSDAFTLVLSSALTIACLPGASELPRRVAVGYIAVQLTLSYFIAGVAKLKESKWRTGQALSEFVALPRYAVPQLLRVALARPWFVRLCALAVLGFECAFPLAWLSPSWCVSLLAAGALFHGLNAWAFGLNRFWPVWLSAYPAVYYVSVHGGLG